MELLIWSRAPRGDAADDNKHPYSPCQEPLAGAASFLRKKTNLCCESKTHAPLSTRAHMGLFFQLAQKAIRPLHPSDRAMGLSAKKTHREPCRPLGFSQRNTFLPIIYLIHAGILAVTYVALQTLTCCAPLGFHPKGWMDFQ